MLGFFDYLEEASKSRKGLFGSIGSERQGIRHLMNYVMPYLSKNERRHVGRNFAQHYDPKKIEDKHGSEHNPDPYATTHELASDHGEHKTGTKVRVTGARHDNNGNIFVTTASHGEIPMSRLKKPEKLAKPVITKGGFEVEKKLADNLGIQAAGSTGTAYDYYYRGHEGGIAGKARKIETDKPYLRGESKQNKAKMGSSALKFDPQTKKWSFTHQKLGDIFSKAVHPDSKLPVLEHLNKYHNNGRIEKGFSLAPPPGMARAYLNGLGVNSLHLHRTEGATKTKKAIDHGTTYTIGNENQLSGKTNLGHLNDSDIDRLDGRLNVAATTTGASTIAHFPNPTVFKEYADNSVNNPEQHADLTNSDHAKLFKGHIDRHISSLNVSPEQAANIRKSISKFASFRKRGPPKKPGEGEISPIAKIKKPGIQRAINPNEHKQHVDHTVGGFNFRDREQQ